MNLWLMSLVSGEREAPPTFKVTFGPFYCSVIYMLRSTPTREYGPVKVHTLILCGNQSRDQETEPCTGTALGSAAPKCNHYAESP